MEAHSPQELATLEAEIRKVGRIGADHVLQLRRAVYRNGSIGREEAEFLFRLNRQSRGDDPAWAEFYVEALTDFFYWREGSDSQLTADAERMLFEWIGRQPAVDDPTELRLLLNLIFRTTTCSERFRALVQKAVERSVLESEHALFGHAQRRPGVIDKADVEVIRRLVYGTGSQNGLAISRAEAEFLFALQRATAGAENDPAWRDLFVKAITMHLLFGGDSPECVDEDEAAWLIDQIGDGALDHANERALLGYLKQEAASLHPLLAPLCQRLGV
ncbi:MAG TPA: hypothetical protein VLE23_05490 [Geminicoccaceae bacterium]|nr:hypothetical protein [Geminicoccaceae bacterium]